MPTLEDVERIALSLPGAVKREGAQLSIGVDYRGKTRAFVWQWLERTDPKKGRVPSPKAAAVSTLNLEIKDILIESNSTALFTEPHYNNYPAVLVWLDKISESELEDLILEAWRCRAPAAMVKEFDRQAP